MLFEDGSDDDPLIPARQGLLAGQRPAYAWLKELERIKEDVAKNPARPRVTIQDLAERALDPGYRGRLLPSSPRSIDACLRLGIDPATLRHIPLEAYARWEKDDALAQMAYDAEEALRQTRLKKLGEERTRQEEQGAGLGKRSGSQAQPGSPGALPGSPGAGGLPLEGTSDMVERETKRLEVLRRRQERELAQLVAHEVARKEQRERAEAKVEALERRAEEQRRARELAAEEWSRQQRERAIARKQEETEKEKEARALEAARHAREAAIAAAEEEEEFKRRQQGYQRELERLAKANAARAETDRILAEQEATIQARREAIEQREVQREAVKAAMMEERAAANAHVQQMAEARIASALEANRLKMEEKAKAAQERWDAADARAKALEEQRETEAKEQRRREREKEEQRQVAYAEAQRLEAERVAEVLRRAADKDAELAALASEREAEVARRALARRLQLKHKAETVEEMKRRDAFERAETLRKIEKETSRSQALMAQRNALQQQRRQANKELAMQRQKVTEGMNKLLNSGGWEKAVAQGVYIASLLRK